jgi:hypothetical protein
VTPTTTLGDATGGGGDGGAAADIPRYDSRTFFADTKKGPGTGRLLVGQLAAVTERHTGRVRASADGLLYCYDDGVYRDDGEALVRHWARYLLGAKATNHYVSEAVHHFVDRGRATRSASTRTSGS